MQKLLGAAFLLLVGFGLAFVVYDRTAMLDRMATRRALESRGTELAAQSVAPASSLACLDGLAGEAAETACEKAIFGRPETVAAAVSYMAARLDLLSSVVAFARKTEPGFESGFAGLRRAIQFDRFGIAAHVLVTRDGCTADKCDAFAFVSDASTLRSNIRARVFSQYVDRHQAGWNAPEEPSVSQAKEPNAAPVAALNPAVPVARPAPSARYDFPSAASIPPVSIMNPEPKGPVSPRGEASGQPDTDAKLPARR